MTVNEKRAYGKIKSVQDLINLQKAADAHQIKAVGITDAGSLFCLDSITGTARAINSAKAKEILQLTDAELSDFIATRGEKDVSTVILEEVETPSTDLPEEIQEDAIVGEVEEMISEAVTEDVATFQEEVVEDTPKAGEPKDDESEIVQETQPAEEPKVEYEDCSIYSDKIALAKSSINRKIEQIDDFKDFLNQLLKVLE